MAANSTVTGNVLVNGPLGIGLLSINNNSATYLQDDGNARTLANGVKFTGCNDITFNSALNGSLTFEPSGTTPTTFALPGGQIGLAITTTLTIDQVITGHPALYVKGGGTLILGAANTYTSTNNFQQTLTVELETSTC